MFARPVCARAGLVVAVSALTACLTAAPAPAADFYAGKAIDFLIGGDVGGGYDIYARVLARHLHRFIPGSPTIVTKNQPGAGSGRAASYPLWRRAQGRLGDRRGLSRRDHGSAAR